MSDDVAWLIARERIRACIARVARADDSNWLAGGRYLDRLERREGAFRIALRTNIIEWSGMLPSTPIPFADVPDIHENGAPARSSADPSYQRPLLNRRRPQQG